MRLRAPTAMEDGMRDAVTLVPCYVRMGLCNLLSRDGAWQQCWNELGRALPWSKPTSPSCSVIWPRWPDPLPTARGWEPLPILLDYSSASQSALLGPSSRRAGVLTRTNAAPEGLQDLPGHVHAPQEVTSSEVPRRELAGTMPAPSPSRCPSWLFALAFMAALFMLRGEHITPCCCCEMQSSETCVCGKTWSFEIGYHWGCNVPVSLC